MAIKGLTDQVAPRFPRLGKLRKGSESKEKTSQSGKTYHTYGDDLSYFRFVGEVPELDAAFRSVYGDAPASLPIYIPYVTPDEAFQTWREKWTAGGLVHRCDGETMTIWRTPDGKFSREPRPCPYHGKTQTAEQRKADPPCDEVGRLELILPELIRAGHVGYVTLETHSLHDMLNIQAALNAAYSARRDLRGIEFTLSRREQEISTPGEDGKRSTRKKWLVYLTPAPRWAQVQLAMAQSAALSLPEPAETVDADTGEIVAPVQLAAPAAAPQIQAPDPRPMPTTLADAYKQGHQDGAKAPAAKTNGHAPAANGDAKRAAVQNRFAQVARDAKAIGVPVEDLPADISTEALIERGVALRKAVVSRADFVINRHPQGKIDLNDSDDQVIAQAIRLYATFQEPADVVPA